MPSLPSTRRRVRHATSDATNRRIEERLARDVAFHAAHPDLIDRRLARLDREWDTERVLAANAATLALAGTLLGAFRDRRFLALPAAVTGFLLQHALQGWCPPLPVIRALGVRSPAEIERERTALKALRGDFAALRDVASASPERRARAALLATR